MVYVDSLLIIAFGVFRAGSLSMLNEFQSSNQRHWMFFQPIRAVFNRHLLQKCS